MTTHRPHSLPIYLDHNVCDAHGDGVIVRWVAGHGCPLCAALEEAEVAERDNKKLREEVAELEEQEAVLHEKLEAVTGAAGQELRRQVAALMHDATGMLGRAHAKLTQGLP